MIQQICRITGKSFTISEKEAQYCKEHNIPFPTLCPEERKHRMYSFSNAVFLYTTQCAFSGKSILSCIPPEKGFTIYDIEIWQSDKWDPISYGREIDWNRPFLEQMAELQRAVPVPNLIVDKASIENSDYCNGVGYIKNCYLLIIGSENEECYFSSGLIRCKNVIDTVWGTDCELCYDSYHITNCYNVRHAEQSANCSDSSFLYNCRGLKNCFGCINLRNKEYCWYNEQKTEAEFRKLKAEFKSGSFQAVAEEKQKFAKFKKQFPIKYILGSQNENSTGDELNNTQNCQDCYFVNKSQDIEHGVQLNVAKDSIDFLGFGNNAELIYRCMSVGQNAYNIKFCLHTWNNIRDLEYCIYTAGSSNCFGCIGLKRKEYCILNKQYSKEEYFDLTAKIREHMRKNNTYGEFFPPSMSYCHYNESEGMTYCPLTREEASARGFSWAEEKLTVPPTHSDLPDNIAQATDEVLTKAHACIKTGKPYRLIKQELDTYRERKIPLPQVAPLERIKEKLYRNKILPLKNIQCCKCGISLTSVHNPAEELVYCEQCFENSLS
ncbi:MAG: hypothetical protein HY817_04130 [Candidatus Abawacabacteria bacterium]|nr:hypothetical protein [Candidatus Abawacabacteria bacterium]